MQPLPRPSVSPLHSFASTPTVRRSPPFAEILGLVWRWLIGRQRSVPMRQQMIEARLIEALSEQLDSLETWERSQNFQFRGLQFAESKSSHAPAKEENVSDLVLCDLDRRRGSCLVRIDNVAGLPALIIEPETTQVQSPVLLFLHGQGEAGSSANEIPKVCIHQTAPFQAILGRLPGTVVIAPQAPPLPNENDWNWAEHVMSLAGFLGKDRFAGRRLVATGFSRGGLGVLQLVSASQSWCRPGPLSTRNPRGMTRRRPRF